MKSKWLTHKEKRIMYCDYSNFEADQKSLQTEVNAVDEIICQQPENSVLVLADVRGSTTTLEAVETFKNSSARTTHHVRKVAVLGITGIRKILLDVVSHYSGQEMTIFDDIEKAKDWLVETDESGNL
jgi:hypothetical protein